MLKNNAENYVNRARIFLEMNDYKNVLSDLFKAIQLDNNYYDAYYNRALLYHDKLEFDSAITDLQKCIDIRPDNDAQDKLSLLQKFMENKNDSLNDDPNQFKYISDSWTDNFRDTQIHLEHKKKIDSNILVASKIKNDNGIKRELTIPLADKTSLEKSITKQVQADNQEQKVSNSLLVSNKTVDNSSSLQNNIKISLPISSNDKMEKQPTEIQTSDKNDTKQSNGANNSNTQKPDNNQNIDFIKTGNNATGQQNNKLDVQISPPEINEHQFAEKIELNKKPDELNQDNSQRRNDIPFAKNTEETPFGETANGSNSIRRTNSKQYAIQLGAFENEENAAEYEQKVKETIDYDINTYQNSGLFKIRTGDYQLKDALTVIKTIRQSGFTNAIIVESEN